MRGYAPRFDKVCLSRHFHHSERYYHIYRRSVALREWLKKSLTTRLMASYSLFYKNCEAIPLSLRVISIEGTNGVSIRNTDGLLGKCVTRRLSRLYRTFLNIGAQFNV